MSDSENQGAAERFQYAEDGYDIVDTKTDTQWAVTKDAAHPQKLLDLLNALTSERDEAVRTVQAQNERNAIYQRIAHESAAKAALADELMLDRIEMLEKRADGQPSEDPPEPSLEP